MARKTFTEGVAETTARREGPTHEKTHTKNAGIVLVVILILIAFIAYILYRFWPVIKP